MAVIGPYDRASFAEYTPLSAQDILMPAMVMAQQHEQLENQYAGLNDELQKTGMIVSHSNEPELQQRYQDYNTNLTNAANSLMEQGVNANTRDNALKLRSAYQSQIAPINMAAQIKSQLVAAHDDRMAKDQTYFGQDPRSITLTSLINNGMQAPEIKGLSGATLVKQAADMADQFAQKVASGDPQVTKFLKGQFGNQYAQVVNKFGMDPMSNDPDVVKVKNYIRQSVLAPYDMNSWADDSQKLRAIQWAEQGLSHLQGKDQTSHLGDKDYDLAIDLAKLRVEKEMNKPKPELQSPVDPITMFDINNNKTSEFNKDLKDIQTRISLGKSNIKIPNMYQSQIDNMVKKGIPVPAYLTDAAKKASQYNTGTIPQAFYDKYSKGMKVSNQELLNRIKGQADYYSKGKLAYPSGTFDNEHFINALDRSLSGKADTKLDINAVDNYGNISNKKIKGSDIQKLIKDKEIRDWRIVPGIGMVITTNDKTYKINPRIFGENIGDYTNRALQNIDNAYTKSGPGTSNWNRTNIDINNTLNSINQALYSSFEGYRKKEGETLSNKQ